MPSPTYRVFWSAGQGPLVKGKGPIRTGVTAILPRGKNYDPVYTGWDTLNGNGDMTGTHWISESGFLETRILITNTGSVGTVRDATWYWMEKHGTMLPSPETTGMHIQLWRRPTTAFSMTSTANTCALLRQRGNPRSPGCG